jgi:hypothetical protein
VEEDAERVAAQKKEDNTLSRSRGQRFANIEAYIGNFEKEHLARVSVALEALIRKKLRDLDQLMQAHADERVLMQQNLHRSKKYYLSHMEERRTTLGVQRRRNTNNV